MDRMNGMHGMDRNAEEQLPQVVEERLQKAYESIRRGGIRQEGKQKKSYRGWISIAAALALIVAVPSAAFAAVIYFQKNVRQEADRLTYEFELNYELTPGEYQVTPGEIPDGMTDQGYGKYSGADGRWITVMPIYTMAELEKANGQIVVEDMEQVEHAVLSGMEADIITFREAEKYQANTYMFLFNEREGYVLHIVAGYKTEKEELLKFADSLSVVKIGDGSYETEEDKELREKEEANAENPAAEASGDWDELMRLGIPQDKIYDVGGELYTYAGAYGYKVTGYEFLDSLEGFAEKDFFDYARFDGWLNADKTLRPYMRQHYDKNGTLLSEEETEQEILRVDLEVYCYDEQWEGLPLDDVSLNFELNYVEKRQDGTYTWEEDCYDAVPSEEYSLQMDNSAVYINVAEHTQGEDRKGFFYHSVEKGESISYTLLFVVDKDRKDNFLLSPVGSNNSIWQCESMTVKEIRDGLEGYIRLE
jgi:hypothetical protein